MSAAAHGSSYRAFEFGLCSVSQLPSSGVPSGSRKESRVERGTPQQMLAAFTLKQAIAPIIGLHYWPSAEAAATLLSMGCALAQGAPPPLACSQVASRWGAKLQASINAILEKGGAKATFLTSHPALSRSLRSSRLRVTHLRVMYGFCNPAAAPPLRTVCLPSRSVPFLVLPTRCHTVYRMNSPEATARGVSRMASRDEMAAAMLRASPNHYVLAEWGVRSASSRLTSASPRVPTAQPKNASARPPLGDLRPHAGHGGALMPPQKNGIVVTAQCAPWCKRSVARHAHLCPCRACMFVNASLRREADTPCGRPPSLQRPVL